MPMSRGRARFLRDSQGLLHPPAREPYPAPAQLPTDDEVVLWTAPESIRLHVELSLPATLREQARYLQLAGELREALRGLRRAGYLATLRVEGVTRRRGGGRMRPDGPR